MREGCYLPRQAHNLPYVGAIPTPAPYAALVGGRNKKSPRNAEPMELIGISSKQKPPGSHHRGPYARKDRRLAGQKAA